MQIVFGIARRVPLSLNSKIVFGLHVFIAHQSGPWITSRTPEDPLVQDSLIPSPVYKGAQDLIDNEGALPFGLELVLFLVQQA